MNHNLLKEGLLLRTPKQYEQVLKVNVVGPFLTTKAFLPLLRKKHSRVVVNTTSTVGSITVNRSGNVPTADGVSMNVRGLGYCSSSK